MVSFPQPNRLSKHCGYQPGRDPPQVQDLTQLVRGRKNELGWEAGTDRMKNCPPTEVLNPAHTALCPSGHHFQNTVSRRHHEN